MDWLWIVQLAMNLAFALLLLFYRRERTVIAPVQAPVRDWEEELFALKKKAEERLRFLVHLCEQAQTILLRHQENGIASKASLEEEELRSLRAHPSQGAAYESIPSVQELEARKQATRPSVPVDLRTLLRDQLS